MSEYLKRMCFDRVLVRAPAPAPVALRSLGPARAVFPIRSLWPNGTRIRIKFMQGTADQKSKVKQWASAWMEHANLELVFDDSADAQIRITFADDGAWSYVGTDCLGIPGNQATMNYGWLDEAVVLHEFGHALGMGHEHQNPEGGLTWNKDVVYRDLGGPPNYWSRAQVDTNVIEKYSRNQIRGSAFDKESIMLYSFPPSWTVQRFSGGDNQVLSRVDKEFAAQMYPKAARPSYQPLTVQQRTMTEADIGTYGEEDLFTFVAQKAGLYTIETEGPTDVVMTLFGPEDATHRIAQDDDSGVAANAKIVADLLPGKYFVQVRHYNSVSGTGKYSIAVSV